MSKQQKVKEQLAGKILNAELQNIVRKVQDGKTLTKAERQLVTNQRPMWEQLDISRRSWYAYKKDGCPENLERARAWITERQALTEKSNRIIVGGKSFTAADLLDLKGQVMEEQRQNLKLKNRIEELNVAEREGRLRDVDELTETLSRIVVPLKKALDALPENIAKAQNPDDPGRAEEILRQELENIYADLISNMNKNESLTASGN